MRKRTERTGAPEYVGLRDTGTVQQPRVKPSKSCRKYLVGAGALPHGQTKRGLTAPCRYDQSARAGTTGALLPG